MAKIKLIPIDAEIADDMAPRLAALKGILGSIRRSLEQEVNPATNDVVDGLYSVIQEIGRIQVDIDICAWEGHKARERTRG